MHDEPVLGMDNKRLVSDHEATNVGAFLFKVAGQAADGLGLTFTEFRGSKGRNNTLL